MYQVIFDDEIHGEITEDFDNYDAAMEYWQMYADTPSCTAGQLWDKSNGEVIWEF